MNTRRKIHELIYEKQIQDIVQKLIQTAQKSIGDEHDVTFDGSSYYGDDGVEMHCILSNEWVKYAGGKPTFVLDLMVFRDGTFNAHITAGFGSENNHYSAIRKPLYKADEILVKLVTDFKHIVKSNHDQSYRKSLN